MFHENSRKGEVSRIAGGDTSADSDRCSSDQGIRLTERSPPPCQRPAPEPGQPPFWNSETRNLDALEQCQESIFIGGPDPSRDLLDIDRADVGDIPSGLELVHPA